MFYSTLTCITNNLHTHTKNNPYTIGQRAITFISQLIQFAKISFYFIDHDQFCIISEKNLERVLSKNWVSFD